MTNLEVNEVLTKFVGENTCYRFFPTAIGYRHPNCKVKRSDCFSWDTCKRDTQGNLDFCNDLNLCHKAEKKLTDEQWLSYAEKLWLKMCPTVVPITQGQLTLVSCRRMAIQKYIHADAPTRAHALAEVIK